MITTIKFWKNNLRKKQLTLFLEKILLKFLVSLKRSRSFFCKDKKDILCDIIGENFNTKNKKFCQKLSAQDCRIALKFYNTGYRKGVFIAVF